MTIYYTTYDNTSTGTYGQYTNNYSNNYSNSTTSPSGTGYNNWDYFSTGTTSSSWTSKLYGSTYINTGYDTGYVARQKVAPKLSEEELTRLREEREKVVEAAKKAREAAEEAARKARLLLTEYLDNENMQRLLKKEPLEVPSRLFGDIKYHIPISNHARIKALKENKVVTELCLAVKDSGRLPTDDVVLTKFLHVLHDEENVLRTANHFNKQENLLARLN
jgi:hypothetical protein